MVKVALGGIQGVSPEEVKKIFQRQAPAGILKWGDLEIVTEQRNPDYFLCIQQDTLLTQHIPKEKKIYIQTESNDVVSLVEFLSCEPLYARKLSDGLNFSFWWVDATYDELAVMSYPDKSKNIHVILSHKRDTPGHRLRTDFVLEYMKVYPDELDIYGTFKNIYRGLRWARITPVTEKAFSVYNRLVGNKRQFEFDKLEVSKPYRYQLVMENAQQTNWVTEKLLDAYLSWNMPIYWGCPNIAEYFPKDSYYEIDIHDPNAISQLHELSQKPLLEKNIAAIHEARNLILNQYNVWPALENYLIEKGFNKKL